MSKTKINKKTPSKEKLNFLGAAGTNLTYKDLKRKAIVLGMPFPDVCAAGVFELIHYINDSDNPPEPKLIDQYDDWVDSQFGNQGLSQDDPLRDSRLRLGFLGETDENGNRKPKRVPGIKKKKEKKPKRIFNQFHLVVGTKKAYVWELASKGYSLDRVWRRVQKKFPEARPRSVSSWYNRANKELYGKDKGKQ